MFDKKKKKKKSFAGQLLSSSDPRNPSAKNNELRPKKQKKNKTGRKEKVKEGLKEEGRGWGGAVMEKTHSNSCTVRGNVSAKPAVHH